MQDQNSKLIRKILISYAMTFMIINLADALTMIADGMVISRGLGSKALAAIGLADPSFKIASLFTGVLAVGLQSLCSQAMGSGDKEKANGIFYAGAITAAMSACVLTLLGFLFTGSLCRLFGAGKDPEIFGHLERYLKGWFTGIPGFIIFFVLSPIVSLDGNKKCVTVATIIQGIINIGGDILAVFCFDMGTYGVGLFTGISYNVSAVILIFNFFRKHSVFRPAGVMPDFRILPKTIRIGLPRITMQISKIAAPILINRTIIAVGGGAAMSAMSVKAGLLGFCLIASNGIAESVGLMTQILYSEKDAASLKKMVRSGYGLLFTLDTLLMLLMICFSNAVSGCYFDRGTVEWTLAGRAIRCLALSMVLNGCNSILIQYLQGARKMKAVHLMIFAHRMLSLTVFTVLLGHIFGINGLFAAIPISEAAVLLCYVIAVLFINRGKGFWDALLLIPDGFGYNSENSLSFSISTVEEAVMVSEKIEAFCVQHNVNRRKGYFSARCMEELATNIVLHGFSEGRHKNHCDIRVMIDPDEVVLRLRDDCPYFNIRERYDSLTDDDIDTSVGIRLVYALAKDISYINIFNTNTLIIRM